jgi:hypothetical protein
VAVKDGKKAGNKETAVSNALPQPKADLGLTAETENMQKPALKKTRQQKKNPPRGMR